MMSLDSFTDTASSQLLKKIKSHYCLALHHITHRCLYTYPVHSATTMTRSIIAITVLIISN